MSGTTNAQYTAQDRKDLEVLIHSSKTMNEGGMRLDSAAAAAEVIQNAKNSAGFKMPGTIDELLGKAPEDDADKIVKAIFDGANAFEREHGFTPTGDLLLSAVHQARTLYDSANNTHHDQLSLHPNAPLVAILGTLAEACPFAGYLPADAGSNEARLIIVSHRAGSDWGDYSADDLIDGVGLGGEYISSARTKVLAAPNDNANYKFNFTYQANGGNPLPLLRGRTVIYVNGYIAAVETGNASLSQATVSFAGTIKLAGTDYPLSGTIKPDSGEVVVTPQTALPNGSVVSVEAFVDYEKEGVSSPVLKINASTFSLFASSARAIFQATPEARTQFAQEVGVDASSEALLAIRGQYAMERHYNALKKARQLAKFVNTETFDFDYALQIQQKVRAQIWQDFQSVCGIVDQRMAILTAEHGATHMYVTASVMAQFLSMPSDLFVPSGITAKPGIYRVGRLFGKYEVYYTPKGLNESADGKTAEILLVGRSSQTARCPIIMGDAAAPEFLPLGISTSQKQGYGFNSRGFTSVNPHQLSANGVALITVINMKE